MIFFLPEISQKRVIFFLFFTKSFISVLFYLSVLFRFFFAKHNATTPIRIASIAASAMMTALYLLSFLSPSAIKASILSDNSPSREFASDRISSSLARISAIASHIASSATDYNTKCNTGKRGIDI